MRRRQLGRCVILFLCAITPLVVEAQSLTCPPGSGAGSSDCSVVHYHARMWRPDTKGFLDVFGTNSYASMAACEAARSEQERRNKAVVDYHKRLEPGDVYEPDRFGSCHCDRTSDRSNSNFLDDDQRARQLRSVEEVRGKVREKLLQTGLKSDAELVVSLSRPLITSTPSLPKLVTVPETSTSLSTVASTELTLKDTRVAGDSSPPVSLDLELGLVEVTAPVGSADQSRRTESEDPVDGPLEGDAAIDRFFTFETSRVHFIQKASAAVTDDAMKNRIFEASMQRLQILSNLRSLVEGSGMKSRLYGMARDATDEKARLALVARLFGQNMPSHWAPADVRDAIVVVPPEIESDPAGVIRDTSGKFTREQRKLALFLYLSRNQALTGSQEVWLAETIESFLNT